MRSSKMDRGSWTYIYGTTLWSGDEKDYQNTVFRVAILKATTFVLCIFSTFKVWPVLSCSRTRYAS